MYDPLSSHERRARRVGNVLWSLSIVAASVPLFFIMLLLIGIVSQIISGQIADELTTKEPAWQASLNSNAVRTFIQGITIYIGTMTTTVGIMATVLMNSRVLYYNKVSNVERIFVNTWKDKKFDAPPGIGDYPKNRGQLREKIRMEFFPKTYSEDYSRKEDYQNVWEAEYKGWLEYSKKLRSEERRSHWTARARYDLSLGLQDLGSLVRGGALPLDIVLTNGSRLIIEDWAYIQDLVFTDMRREGNNIMPVFLYNSINSRGIATEKFDETLRNAGFGAHRRHAEWISLLSCIYWRSNYSDGMTDLIIVKTEKTLKDFHDKIPNLVCADWVKSKYPGNKRLHSIPNIVYRENILRAADIKVFGEDNIRVLLLDSLMKHSVHSQAKRAFYSPNLRI
jgi:hypothetical protein